MRGATLAAIAAVTMLLAVVMLGAAFAFGLCDMVPAMRITAKLAGVLVAASTVSALAIRAK